MAGEWLDGGWMNGEMNKWMFEYTWMDDGWMDDASSNWMIDRWMYRWMNG